jgi:hypothetical protein
MNDKTQQIQQVYKKPKISISKLLFKILEIFFYTFFFVVGLISWYSVKLSCWIMFNIKEQKPKKVKK